MCELMSLREFAKYVRVSPQRLNELIEDGKVKRYESGLIPSSEREYFIREELLKGISRQKKSVLYIEVNNSDEASASNIEQLKTIHSVTDATYISSIDNLVACICNDTNNSFNVADEAAQNAELNRISYAYRLAILKEFGIRLNDAFIRLLEKASSAQDLAVFPLISIKEMLLFGKLYTDTGIDIEALNEALNKPRSYRNTKEGSDYTFEQLMSRSFTSIVTALNMKDTTGNFVVTRETLTPEFIQAIDGVSIESQITKNHPLYNYFNSNMLCGASSAKRSEGADAEKIKNQVINEKRNLDKSRSIGSYTFNGTYSIRNITNDMDIDELQKLIGDIQNGYYNHVVILADEETAKNYLRESFYMAVRGMALTKCINLEFSSGAVNSLKYFKRKKSVTNND